MLAAPNVPVAEIFTHHEANQGGEKTQSYYSYEAVPHEMVIQKKEEGDSHHVQMDCAENCDHCRQQGKSQQAVGPGFHVSGAEEMEPAVKTEIGTLALRRYELVLAMALALGTPVRAAVGNTMIDFANMFQRGTR